MDQLNSILVILKDIVVVLCPVILAIFTYKTSKKEKSDKKYRELRQKVDEATEKARKERETKIDSSLTELSEAIDKVTNTVNKIDMESIQSQLDDLKEINGLNLDYSQSLSRVVVKIADCMKDSGLSKDKQDAIGSVIEEHQATEQEITKSLYKFLY